MGEGEASKLGSGAGIAHDVAIGIITCPRPGGVDYVGATVRDMFKRQPDLCLEQVKVFSDSIARPESIPEEIQVECSTQERLDEIKARKVRGTYNWIRSMKWQVEQGRKWCLHLEDDLLFANNWLRRGIILAEHVEKTRLRAGMNDRFIASLCHGTRLKIAFDYDVPLSVPGHDRTARWNRSKDRWGALSYMMTRATLSDLLQYMEQAMRREPLEARLPYCMDNGALRWLKDTEADIYDPHPGLVQHMGESSAAWPGRFQFDDRRINNFDDPDRVKP